MLPTQLSGSRPAQEPHHLSPHSLRSPNVQASMAAPHQAATHATLAVCKCPLQEDNVTASHILHIHTHFTAYGSGHVCGFRVADVSFVKPKSGHISNSKRNNRKADTGQGSICVRNGTKERRRAEQRGNKWSHFWTVVVCSPSGCTRLQPAAPSL